MNITKEQADKVIAALEAMASGLEWFRDMYPKEVNEDDHVMIAEKDEALSIMRGLEDAEPVAICAVTPQGEVSIGWRHGYKPRHNENLYTSPQAAQTEGWTGDNEIDAALIMLDRREVGPHDDDRLDEIAKLLRKLAGRAGRKG